MRTVFKYQLTSGDLELPKDATVLMVRDGFLWAEVETEAETELRRFRVFGTGHEIPKERFVKHVASWVDAPFVWHLYEVS